MYRFLLKGKLDSHDRDIRGLGKGIKRYAYAFSNQERGYICPERMKFLTVKIKNIYGCNRTR